MRPPSERRALILCCAILLGRAELTRSDAAARVSPTASAERHADTAARKRDGLLDGTGFRETGSSLLLQQAFGTEISAKLPSAQELKRTLQIDMARPVHTTNSPEEENKRLRGAVSELRATIEEQAGSLTDFKAAMQAAISLRDKEVVRLMRKLRRARRETTAPAAASKEPMAEKPAAAASTAATSELVQVTGVLSHLQVREENRRGETLRAEQRLNVELRQQLETAQTALARSEGEAKADHSRAVAMLEAELRRRDKQEGAATKNEAMLALPPDAKAAARKGTSAPVRPANAEELRELREALELAGNAAAEAKETERRLRQELTRVEALRHGAAEREAAARQALAQALEDAEAHASAAERLRAQVAPLQEQVVLSGQAAEAAEAAEAAMREERAGMMTERRRLQGMLQELRGNIRVMARVRPPADPAAEPALALRGPQRPIGFGLELRDPAVARARALEHERALESPLATPRRVETPGGRGGGRGGEREAMRFVFDHVLAPGAAQAEVFEEVEEMVESVLDGYKVCVLAYGQTGSGKTYTMQGPEEPGDAGAALGAEAGLIPRAVEKVFAEARARAGDGWTHTARISFLEIYREAFRDLLDARGSEKPMEVARDEAGNPFVAGLVTLEAPDAGFVHDLVRRAARARATAATQNNDRSSRSHAVFTLSVECVNRATGQSLAGGLTLVDLAGSERFDSSACEERQRETQAINKSLFNLGDVIAAIASGAKHVPFRNSKLTQVLQPYLTGGSKTLMLVTLAPDADCFEESLRCARFATRVSACDIGTARRCAK